VHKERSVDTSQEITCSSCGFSGLPTSFELASQREKKSWQVTKVVIIVLAGVLFATIGLSLIVMAAFYLPFILVAVVIIYLLKKWRDSEAQPSTK